MTADFWMIELIGCRHDLLCFERWFSDGIFKVIIENEKFFLVGTFLVGCTTAAEAMDRAESKLELMTAAARLEYATDALVVKAGSVVYVDSVGNDHYHEFDELVISLHVSERYFDSCIPSLAQRAVTIADFDTHLDNALRLWGEASRSWPKLYRIAEEVTCSFEPNEKRYMSDVLLSEGLVDSRDEIHRFRHSACDPVVAGRDARHARSKMPREVMNLEHPTMSHQDAVALVGSLLSRAIRRKWEAISDGDAYH
jgi:hypothetical protein